MRRIVLVVALFLSTTALFAKGYETRFSKPSNNTYQISFNMGEWNSKTVTIDGVTYQNIAFDAMNTTMKKGWAELPFISANICIDDQKPFEVRVIGSEYKDYVFNHQMLPSRGVIYRDQDPSTIAYSVDPASIVDEMYPGNLTSVEGPYIFRDVRGITVQFYPFQFNAATKTLRVYQNIIVEVVESEGVGENPITQKGQLFRDYHNMYKSMFLNYGNEKDDLPIVAEYGDILVVTTARDEAAIEPYIQWKKEKGFNVEKLVVATGTNIVSNSNNLVLAAYNANPNIMFVQIVGDWNDVKCNQGGGANAPMDPMVGRVIGTDNFPDIAVGRFSCSNAAQLTAQVNKTINYEKNPDDADWYSSSMHIASNEGGSGQGDDGESDRAHQEIIWNNKLSQDTYTLQYKHYDGQGNTSPANVTTSLTNGVSIANYTGHGSMTSWVTTGFSNSNVNALNNGTKLPFIFSVACNNGDFHNGTCFAEAWLQKENGGAIAAVMASISQPWVPPMVGQDYFNDILTGGYDYTSNPGNGTSTNERRTLFGNIHVNGQCLMLAENQSSNLETAQTWNLFGDASFQIRTAHPKTLAASNTTIIVGTPYQTTLTADGDPVSNAQVCISQNGVYVSAFSDENGMVSIENSFQPGDVLLVVTAFNTTTIYQNIDCVPADGSFLIAESSQLSGDGMLSFGNTSLLSLTMKNVGNDPTTENTTVTLACADPKLTVSGTATYNVIASGATATAENAFTLEVAEDIDNEQIFTVSYTAVCGDQTWEGNLYLKAYKPVIEYDALSWQGNYTPGETLMLTVGFKNIGGYTATNSIGVLSSASEFVTIAAPSQSLGNIAPTGVGMASYSVTISEDCPSTEILLFQVAFTADGGITAEGTFELANSCNVVFDLEDSYGDGWNGAKLRVSFDDGTPQIDYTFSDGSSASYTTSINSGTNVTLSWISGNYDEECSFTVSYEGGEQIYSTQSPNSGVLHSFICQCAGEPINCDPVSDLVVEVNGNNVNLEWEGNAASYIIKRNGVEVGTSTSINYTDENVASGIYDYCVFAVCEGGAVSIPVCESITIGSTNYTITATVGENGTISPEGVIDVVEGNSQTFTITPNEGYKIEDILVDGQSVGAVNTYTFNNVTANHTIAASFSIISHIITATAGENGTITPEGEVSVEDGASQTFTFTPNTNFEVADVLVDGASVGIVDEYTFENVTEDHTIAVNFIEKTTIAETVANNYSVYPNPATTRVLVKGDNMKNVMVYNVVGQLIETIIVEQNSSVAVNVSSYDAGIYIFRITTTDGTLISKRVVVSK
ncbi:MAG: C25 family cysteine peptidase [Bacteroidales bacterium]|nr:C25 family cysteine peptidase [Bacteroidales bacterium]